MCIALAKRCIVERGHRNAWKWQRGTSLSMGTELHGRALRCRGEASLSVGFAETRVVAAKKSVVEKCKAETCVVWART